MGSIPRMVGLRSFAILAAIATAMGLVAAVARSAVAPGGLGAADTVAVADVVCVARCVGTRKAVPGGKVKVRGLAMDQVAAVVFRGADGPIQVSPLSTTEAAATARIPSGALSGRPYVVDVAGAKSSRAPHKLLIVSSFEIPPAAFPVRGPHTFGDGFGAGRGH